MQGQVIRISGSLNWLTKKIRDQPKPILVSYRYPQSVRKVLRKRKLIPVSKWAERHRYVTRGPFEGTKYRNDTVPYAGAIMDASFFPSVEEIVLCAADQVAKSFVIDTCVGYCVDRMPGPVLYVYPDEKTAKENSVDRIQTMFEYSPRLKSYTTGNPDDMGQQRINLSHMQIYMSWARSAISLANKSIKYLITDEEDKYPETAGTKEAGPVDKARKRLRTFNYGRKHWRCSTPTIPTGPIWTAINECQAVFEFQVVCPDCGKDQVMRFEQIKFGDERDPVRVRNIKNLTWYECPFCGTQSAEGMAQSEEGEGRGGPQLNPQRGPGSTGQGWTDAKRNMAVRMGRWVSMAKTPDGEREIEGGGTELFKYLEKYRPRTIGFYVPAWLSRFVGLNECAAAFLEGLKNKNKLKDFRNSFQAIPWQDITAERAEDSIMLLRDDRPRGIVPSGEVVSCLTAGVDTQDYEFWYEIRAWGWGEALTSWQIREGVVLTFEDLEDLLFNEVYRDRDGLEYPIRLVLQDAMGHRTKEVYDFVRKRQGRIFATQGQDTARAVRPLSWSNIEFYPGKKKPIPGGIRLLRVDVNYFKNELSRRLGINLADPGAWVLNSDTTFDYARHMCAEGLNEKGYWEQIAQRPNHLWDCGVLNLAAAEVMRVQNWKRPEPGSASASAKASADRGNGWMGKREGWLKGRR